MEKIIAPSLLSADFLQLGKDIDMINSSNAQWIHCDIMDGHFVPNLSFGMPVLHAIRKATPKVMDVHLMITNAEHFINQYIDAGADVLTVHYEAVTHLHRTLQEIKRLGAIPGVSLNPHTPVHLLQEILPYAGLVLIMSVNPGFGGQKFIESSIDKIKNLKTLCQQLNPDCLIQVDGGINRKNASILFESGASVLVAGNAVFSSDDPKKEIEVLLNC